MKWVLFFFMSLVLMSCTPKSTPIDDSLKISSQLLSFPAAFYDNVVYIDNKLIAFSLDLSKPRSEIMSFTYEGDSNLYPFKPGQDPTCRLIDFTVFGGILPDGRLGLLRDCWTEALRPTSSIFAYNWQKDTLEQIVNGPIAEGPLPKTFTWNPPMTKGVQQMGNGIEGTIYWISPEGSSPMDIEIEDQGLKWNLKDYFEGKTEHVGSASYPAWSPDGKTIAFFASAYGIREEPRPKMNAKRALYLMNVDDLKPVQVILEIPNSLGLRWSPDSRQLLFSGCIGFQFKCALWLFDTNTKSLALIDEGDFLDFIWIDNQKIVAIKNITLPFDDNQIFEYSIEHLAQP